jgi:4-hydroxy-tetrahydrodipicolinate synthase
MASVAQGVAGGISPAANVFPHLVIQMYACIRNGELDEARSISNRLAPLRIAWGLGSFPVVIKEAMTLVGRSAGPARPPIHGLDSEALAKLRSVVDSIQLAEQQQSAA